MHSHSSPHGLEVLRTYGTGFAGRQAELAALDQAWETGVRVFVLHAQGGAGKTRVVAQWLNQVRDDGWRGSGQVFVHSFYSQGSDKRRNASSELFFEAALAHFGHSGPPLTDPTEKGRALARLIGEQRGLLVLDGIEPLQHPPAFDQGRLKDPALLSLLLALAAGWVGDTGLHGLCLVTSRQPVVELADKAGRVVVQQPLERLDPEAGAELLRKCEVAGPDEELRQASVEFHGHAYSLMLLGSFLQNATDDRDILRRHNIELLAEDAEHRNHARTMFAAYVRHLGESSLEVAVLRLLGFFDRPAQERLLEELREADDPALAPLIAGLRDLSKTDWRRVLSRLRDLHLIDIPVGPSPPIDAHPLLRECFGEQVRTQFPAAWQAGNQQLFEVLCNVTEHRPATLSGLQPLYQAVVHGCLAGLHQKAYAEVYTDRILRGTGADGFYSRKKLGAIGEDLGALACFFTAPWTTLAPSFTPDQQTRLLNDATLRLRAQVRLAEAAEPNRLGIKSAIEKGDWENAAISVSNLSELELARGEVAAAVAAGEQAVTYADRSRVAFQQMSKRTTQADALHQMGRRDEARSLFEDAEARQAADQTTYPRLYSLWGFRYCDLLLAGAERAAWQRWLRGEAGASSETLAAAVESCEAVRDRAEGAQRVWRKFRNQSSILDIAWDHLTLARATLYRADFALPVPASAYERIAGVVDDFRAANTLHHLPRGLLTRAWLRYLSGDEAGGRTDLEESWEIAERGPMPLFQADVLLTRARLFRDRAALAEARRLIEKHGYGRRLEELADAEEAAAGWPDMTHSSPARDSRAPSAPHDVESTQRAESTVTTFHTPLPPVDFVIITPLGEEREALLTRLPGCQQLPPADDDLLVHYAAELPVLFSNGLSTSYSIIVTPLARMGHTEASSVTSGVIHRWKPRYVLLVGIAGGMKKAGVRLGDVLISDQVADYELAKVTAGQPEIRWQVHQVDERLLRAAQNFRGDGWHRTESRRYDKETPKVHFGPICTGNKVVADEGLAAQLQEAWAKLIGVEMEAGGVASAASQSARPLRFFMIRGVSDLADGKKGSRSVKRWRPYACEIAAAWAVEFLKSGPVPADPR